MCKPICKERIEFGDHYNDEFNIFEKWKIENTFERVFDR